MQPLRIFLLLCLMALPILSSHAQDDPAVTINKPGAYDGYTLYSPLDGAGSYLINNNGRVIHFWDADYRSNISYLQNDGSLIRTTSFGNWGNHHFFGGGAGYSVQELSWDGEVTWEFVYSSEDHLMHHDIEPLPNGNVLLIAWELKTVEETIQAGRNPELIGDKGLWPLHIVEVKPKRPFGGKIVWEWHIWDHLIQDFDSEKDNYGDPQAHPERIEINPPGLWMDSISEEEREQLEALGYLGGEPEDSGKMKAARYRSKSSDWLHTNAIAYNAELDQIAVSLLGNNEILIIDHSTSTKKARGSKGGNSGKGGDILYRWGNPVAYRAGAHDDQTLFAQHNVQWIAQGLPGAGNLLIFNNGRGRNYSSILELEPPIDANGNYELPAAEPAYPLEPLWEYSAPNKKDFYSMFISGARRLPNGNTLICYGAKGTIFEVTPEGETVWNFVNAVMGPKGSSHFKPENDSTNIVFRAHRYRKDHPAFKNRNLKPGLLLSEFIKKTPPRIPVTEAPETN